MLLYDSTSIGILDITIRSSTHHLTKCSADFAKFLVNLESQTEITRDTIKVHVRPVRIHYP